MSTRQRQWGALLSIVSLIGSLALAEAAFRLQRPPRVQVVSANQADISEQDGVVYWRSRSRGEREREACLERGGTAKAVIFGSSILFGVQLPFEETIGAPLEEALGGCVVNLAQPASSFQTQAATAASRLADYAPEIVIWEVWKNSPNDFTLVNGTAYNFGNLAVDDSGVPSPFGLSSSVNRALFGHSALYRYVAITQAGEDNTAVSGAAMWTTFSASAIEQMQALTGDARLILPMMPPLSVPFEQTAAQPPPGYAAFVAAAEAAGIQTIDVAAAMAGQDHEALRLDPCCHLNAAGQAVLAGVLAEAISAPRPPAAPR